METKELKDVVVGDVVVRNLGGVLMELKVTDLTDELIICGGTKDEHVGWRFGKKTGAEVDEDLGWGPPPKYTGSYIIAYRTVAESGNRQPAGL
jgi:hypothetical protein